MYKKMHLYFLLSTSLVTIHLLQPNDQITELCIENNQENNLSYDHLDFLGDNLPEIERKPSAVPNWVKSFLIRAILQLVNFSEFWQKSWKKFKETFAKEPL